MKLSDKLFQLHVEYDFTKKPPLAKDLIVDAINKIDLPIPFIELYLFSNGLSHEWFRILPLEDAKNIKSTWDSIQKANNEDKSKFEVDHSFLDRFVIFAEIGSRECAVLEKSTGLIWYESEGQLHQTDLTLGAFIEACFKEIGK